MKKQHQTIYDLFSQIISQKVRDIQWCTGSIIVLDFGMDLISPSCSEKEIFDIRPEWNFWIYIAFWELEIDGKILIDCNKKGNEIKNEIQKLKGKKLLNVFGNEYDMLLTFEDKTILNIVADNNHSHYEQWSLFTPDRMVLTAGPFKKLTYKHEDEPSED